MAPITKSTPTQTPNTKPAESAFERADKELEAAQSLCEVAAYQFLRDGNCQLELEGIKQRFESALAISKLEREKLEKEKLKEEREEIEKTVKAEDTSPLETVPTVTISKPTQPATMDSGIIEVDDESDSASIEVDISAFRAGRMTTRAPTSVA